MMFGKYLGRTDGIICMAIYCIRLTLNIFFSSDSGVMSFFSLYFEFEWNFVYRFVIFRFDVLKFLEILRIILFFCVEILML